MSTLYTLLLGLSLSAVLASPSAAQNVSNDGFQRRNGQMHILRNGQARPMLRDAHLPTGAVVTRDGFVVGASGKRTELREGQGCDLKGNLVTVVSDAGRGVALRAPAAGVRRGAPAPENLRTVLADFLSSENADADRTEYDDQYEQQARELRKEQEKWLRESRKHRPEHGRGRGKKGKGKWKKGKKWDD